MKIKWTPGQVLPTFDYIITILNKLSYRDSPTKLDQWKSTVLENCAWSSNVVRTVSGTTVSLGSAFIVRVPKSDDYHPYHEWAQSQNGFTFSLGDYIIKGVVNEEVTPNNILTVVNKYRPEAFEVKYFKDNTKTIEALEHYHLEGI